MTTPPPEPRLPMLGGRYRLVERIARGGMGEVWRAFDEVLNRPVAVKVLRPEYADEHVFLERFRNEARNTAALIHTGIAAVYDFGQAALAHTVVPFIVMELVPGRPLSMIIERDGPLSPDRALDITAQAARALHAAHEAGVVHRDVKPANLLITPSWSVKITDFGIARAGDTVPLTRAGIVMGTAHYLAPELVNGRGPASASSDIYALGVVLYECLSGRRPFAGDNPLAVAMEHLNTTVPPIPDLHPAIAGVLAATLEKDPAARPVSAAVLARSLLALRIDLAADDPTPDAAAESIGEAADAVVVHRAASRSRGGGGHRRGAAASAPARGGSVAPVVRDPRAVPLPVARQAARDAMDGASSEVTQPGMEIGGFDRSDAPARSATSSAGRHRIAVTAPGSDHRRRPVGRRVRRRRTVMLSAATGTVAIVIGLLWHSDTDSRPGVAMVPSVAGATEPDATRVISSGGFAIKVDHRTDDSVPAGVVLTQSPAAGTQAATHSAVSILVSAGPPDVNVEPAQWRGKAYTYVSRGLAQLGLRIERRDVAGGGAPGTVTDVSPRGQVPVGGSVTVSVVGPPRSGTNVPGARQSGAQLAAQGAVGIGRNGR